MSLAFSSNEIEVLHKTTEVKSECFVDVKKCHNSEVYELDRCTSWIILNKLKRVALQFPDCQLVDSVDVALKLEKATEAEIFILGDVTYGSCCVDCISAEHAGADGLIHFGPSCLSPLAANSIPVLFIFVQAEVDCQHATSLVRACGDLMEAQCLLLLYETSYVRAANVLGEQLKEFHQNVVVSDLKIPGEEKPPPADSFVKCQRIIVLPENIALSQCAVLYLGCENMAQTNLIMNFNQCLFYTLSPSTVKLVRDSIDVNRTLRRRFYIVERLKDAQIIGILVGTLGVNNYVPLIDHLKTLVKHRKRRCYVLAVGKPNVPKLANFPEIQAFVLVACPENTLLDSKEYLAPIATPFELELALNSSRDFQNGQYITDYSQLLPGGANHVPLDVNAVPESDVSLVTGGLRYLDIEEEKEHNSNSGSSVVIRNGMALATLHARAGGEHLSQRSWQGLEQQLGMTPVSSVKQGQSGIAAEYKDEG